MYKQALIFLAVSFISLGSAALPPQIKVCPKNTPNLADCFKSSIETLKPLLKTGEIAPGFKIEGIDPLFVGNLSINQGFEVNQWETKAYGISDFEIDKIRVILDNFKIQMILSVPKVSTKAKYNLRFQLGALLLQGGGDGYAYLENVKIQLKLTGSRYPKNGIEYVKVDKVRLSVKPAKIRIRYENLFNGQKEMESFGNNYIEQNIDSIAKDITPQIERLMEKKILQVANEVFEKAPFKDFFP